MSFALLLLCSICIHLLLLLLFPRSHTLHAHTTRINQTSPKVRCIKCDQQRTNTHEYLMTCWLKVLDIALYQPVVDSSYYDNIIQTSLDTSIYY